MSNAAILAQIDQQILNLTNARKFVEGNENDLPEPLTRSVMNGSAPEKAGAPVSGRKPMPAWSAERKAKHSQKMKKFHAAKKRVITPPQVKRMATPAKSAKVVSKAVKVASKTTTPAKKPTLALKATKKPPVSVKKNVSPAKKAIAAKSTPAAEPAVAGA